MDNENNTTGYYITTPNGDRYYQPPLDTDTTHGPERARVYCFGAPNQKPLRFWDTKYDVLVDAGPNPITIYFWTYGDSRGRRERVYKP